jgi:CheY-like chemotaxis protein
MSSEDSSGVSGRRILLVEDEYLIAFDVASLLESKGAEVIGPAASVHEALGLLETGARPDAAVLDINLGDERVFPVAEELQAANVPFVFLSGYDARVVPGRYTAVPCCTKPLDRRLLVRVLTEALGG